VLRGTPLSFGIDRTNLQLKDTRDSSPSDASMPDPKHLDFLAHLGAGRKCHSGRSLLDHLEGTARLLMAWGSEPDVCVAGLFHSVYGTNAFHFRSLSLDDRARLIGLIGLCAEQLVYLFCTSLRPRALVAAADTGVLASRFDGTTRPVSAATLQQLLEIECANLIEQGGGRKTLASIADLHGEGRLSMDPRALQAIRKARDRCLT